MISNVRGRVRNTPLPRQQGLMPLFEAIINSIDAIEDRGLDVTDGRIDIKILRQKPLNLSTTGDSEHDIFGHIYGFEVIDNGIGFTELNYQAFNEADTQFKESRGGKGVGRFLWLKAFKKVEICSIYKQDDQYIQRSFVFSLDSNDGISHHEIKKAPSGAKEQTIVRLLGFFELYERNQRHDADFIAQRILEHFLEYYVLTRMPVVNLIDDDAKQTISLDELYDKFVAENKPERITIKNVDFDIIHFSLYAHSELKHHISYCANRRVVLQEKLGNKIPNLPSLLNNADGKGTFIYAAYISSEYLDRYVNQQRMGFDTIPEHGLEFSGELTWTEIEESILSACKKILHPYTEAIRIKKEDRIREYVAKQAPQYRHILKSHAEYLDDIPPEISDEKLDTYLYDISRQIESSLKQKADELLQSNILISGEQSYEEQLNKFSEWWQEYNEIGKASLAKYIIHRKMVLTFLEKALTLQDTGKYSREEIIHEMIFPLKKTSDDIIYDQHNLWLIDEKLAYHHYLASDLSLKKIDELESDSLIRPDLLVFFDRAIAVVSDDPPYNSGIVIFEFKRPMRNDYSASDNPIQQIYHYVQEIKEGRAITKDGRPIQIPPQTPFYCYVVCDLTPEMRNQAIYAGLHSTPDNLGFFGYNPEIGVYTEVIGFDKLLGDANKRNKILFNKLNLPDKIP